MENLNFSGKFKNNEAHVNVNIGLLQFEEEGTTIIYSPAFDLSGYGKTSADAKSSFAEAIDEFFRYTINKKTLVSELNRLGWKVTSISQKKIKAPQLADLITRNDYLSEILNDKQFTKFDQTVSIPC